MPSRPALTVCLDANVLISAFAFGGIPVEVMLPIYERTIYHVTSRHILEETRRNLVTKLKADDKKVAYFLTGLEELSILVVPTSKIKLIPHIADSKVLEVAIMGKCDVLVTGDKKHLLLLKSFQGVAIESPSHFLKRLKTLKGS